MAHAMLDSSSPPPPPPEQTPHLVVFSGGTAFNGIAGYMCKQFPRGVFTSTCSPSGSLSKSCSSGQRWQLPTDPVTPSNTPVHTLLQLPAQRQQPPTILVLWRRLLLVAVTAHPIILALAPQRSAGNRSTAAMLPGRPTDLCALERMHHITAAIRSCITCRCIGGHCSRRSVVASAAVHRVLS